MYRSALASQEELLGPEHPEVANTRNNLGINLYIQGKHVEAEAMHRRALAVRQKVFGADHVMVATSHSNLGVTLHAQDRWVEAEAELRRALELREAGLDADHQSLAASRLALAVTLLELGREGEALPLAEQAWDRISREGEPVEDQAETTFTLARALWATGGDRRRAGELARRALALYEEAGATQTSNAAEVRTWVQEHL
jgi:tetratricopeptide (TPR) repeat protein